MLFINSALLILGTITICKCDDDPVRNDKRILKQPPHYHWGTPSPNSKVKLSFIPYRMLASVRHEVKTEHLPRSSAVESAKTPAELILAQRLKESISVKKLGEVYTEQGYDDKKYDHGYHDKHGDYHEKYENFDRAKLNSKKPIKSTELGGDSTYNVPVIQYKPLKNNIQKYSKKIIPSESTQKEKKLKYDNNKYPFYNKVNKHSPLRYATNPNLLPKKSDNTETPFYDSTNYKECPEISPELNVGPDNNHPRGEPRLKGLGDKIDCLTSKYFGENPFDNPFFQEDEISAPEKPIKTASSEHIEGLLPPPSNHRLVKRTAVYSAIRGGVKFTDDDLNSDGSEIDTQYTQRISPLNKFGARELRPNSRTSYGYEVTEEPEEPVTAANTNKYVNRPIPNRRVQVEHHRSVTKEEVYSSTYVPADSSDVMTTTVWNAPPEVETYTPRSNFETRNNIVKNRSRSRPLVTPIREDVFDTHGERTRKPNESSTADVLRSRTRTNRNRNNKVTEIQTTQAPPQDVFLIPTENISPHTETYDIPITTSEKSAPVDKLSRLRGGGGNVEKVATEKIPLNNNLAQSNRVTVARPHNKPPPVFANAAPVPIKPAIIANAVPAPLQPAVVANAAPAPVRAAIVPNAVPAPLKSSVVANAVPAPIEDNPNTQVTSGRRGSNPGRSKSGRQEAFKAFKQDYTARIPVEASRYQDTPARTSNRGRAPSEDTPTRTSNGRSRNPHETSQTDEPRTARFNSRTRNQESVDESNNQETHSPTRISGRTRNHEPVDESNNQETHQSTRTNGRTRNHEPVVESNNQETHQSTRTSGRTRNYETTNRNAPRTNNRQRSRSKIDPVEETATISDTTNIERRTRTNNRRNIAIPSQENSNRRNYQESSSSNKSNQRIQPETINNQEYDEIRE